MLHQQLIFLSLVLIFVRSFAQEYHSNDRYRIIYRHQRQAISSQSETKQSNQNSSSSLTKESSSNVKQPVMANQLSNIPLASSTLLAKSVECKGDIQKYCMKNSRTLLDNLKVLQCIDDLDNAVNLISKECQNKIYRFKYNMTRDVRFDDTAMKVCKKDIKLLEDCNDHTDERGTGRLISCLYDLFDNITEPTCRYFIEQIQSTIFTDWRLSERFSTACLADIVQLKCGRLDDDNESLPHEQGAVVSCLSKNQGKLAKDCLRQISRLAEMQSDDYHLDRALYYACREDRERFCSQVTSGNGRVYRCLDEQKLNNMMTSACREEVHRRQEMIVRNALLNAPLIRVCKNEMREHRCVANPQDPDKQLSLVNLLLCLEKRIKSGNTINDQCRREMLIHRRMLMSDYAISPEIISDCKTEMIQHCSSLYQKGASGTIDQRGGRMIHCLLNAARKEKNFSHECLSNVKSLVRAVDPGSDIRADPLLEATCRPVIDALCAKIKPGDSNVIMCLLDNMKSTKMTEDCEDRLMEISYFMLRDWRLTPRLLGTCRADLEIRCQLPQNWTMGKEMKGVRIGKYLSCLNRQKNQLNLECRSELKRLMRIRSQSVGLMPEIEDNCIIDLATCKNPDAKGEELKCLQKKYNKLETECKKAVGKDIEIKMKDPTMDFSLMKSCESMIQLFCSNIENNHENDLIRCLIKQKNNQKMDYRCKANLEHHQLLSLKDAAFLSEQFQTKCEKEINEHCQGKKTKSALVQCLARLMLQDVLKKSNQLKEECRDELKFELLERGESINFDPALAKACRNDIQKFCSNKNPGNAQVLDCLKSNRNKVSTTCYRKLNQREKVDLILPDNDYSLTTNCAPVIQKFCANENKQNILSCLRRNANRDVTTTTCRNVLYHRLMVLNSDARFNKALIDNCQNDITKYCQGEVIDDDDEDDDENDDDDDENNENNDDAVIDGEVKDRDMGGRIINCLRTKYANKNAELEPKCMSELADVIQTSKLDVQLDVKLYQNCKFVLDTKCPGVEKEDCLKLLYQQKEINHPACEEQVIRIIKEGQADIHVDQVLAIACQTDVLRFCNDIPIGGGKQLQCLVRLRESVTNTCKNILSKRQELWSSISDVDDIDDLTRHIVYSSNNFYLYSIIFLLILLIFLAGCICRPFLRYRRLSKYQ